MGIKVTKCGTAKSLYKKDDNKYVINVAYKSHDFGGEDGLFWRPYEISDGRSYEVLPEKIQINKLAYFGKGGRKQSFSDRKGKDKVMFAIFNEDFYEIRIPRTEDYYSNEELDIYVKEKIYKNNKKFEEIKKTVEAYEKYESNEEHIRRQPIPEDVKFEVWRRDGGKCVICGSQKNLEFDHIIPFSKGGSSTARNLQLLCQECNRKKSNKI